MVSTILDKLEFIHKDFTKLFQANKNIYVDKKVHLTTYLNIQVSNIILM